MSGEPSTAGASSKSNERPKSKIFDSVKRVFTIKKKEGKTKSSSSTPEVEKSAPVLPVPAAAAAPAAASAAAPAVETKRESPVLAAPVEATPAATTGATKPTPRIPRASRRPPPGPPPPIQTPAERAQALFKKHGLEFVPTQWVQTTPRPVERVHKEIRMRVHRQCHKCNTSYGADPTCLSCGHRRCKQCPRFPSKKDKGKDKEHDHCEKPVVKKPKNVVTLPSRTGGQDLVKRPIRQRVHRTCHRCQTAFGSEKVCSKCEHNRCKKCPRDPVKKNKPPGYYDDKSDSESEHEPAHGRPLRTYKKIKRRVRWTCSKCSQTFKGEKICEGCGSNRDDTGMRDPPKKTKNPNAAIPSESYIESLQDRLMATTIS